MGSKQSVSDATLLCFFQKTVLGTKNYQKNFHFGTVLALILGFGRHLKFFLGLSGHDEH